MKILDILDEDFVNFKMPSMYIGMPYCSMKCGRENCQNAPLEDSKLVECTVDGIVSRYLNNNITKAIIFCGLEPFDSRDDLIKMILAFREKTDDPIVIYTGYTEEELISGNLLIQGSNENINKQAYEIITSQKNIVIKFGRFIVGQEPHYDAVLGVKLASLNQYAKEFNYDRKDA